MTIEEVKSALVRQAGGYLRNTVLNGTCPVCRTLVTSEGLCGPCASYPRLPARPDVLGFMTYAGPVAPIEQSMSVMYGYKRDGRLRSDSAYTVVALMAYIGIRGHLQCPARLTQRKLTHWATVSSLRGRQTHPLRDIVAANNDEAAEIVLVGDLPRGGNPRDTSPAHYRVSTHMLDDAHVLLIDDTWVSGAHVRSATMALRIAGAATVSALSLARWLSKDWTPTVEPWARRTFTGVDFDPDICPWTAASCPT